MSTEPESIDPAALRQITLDVLGVAAKIAAFTPTPVDDQIVATVTDLVGRDLFWAIFQRLILRGTTASVEEVTNCVMAGFGDDDKPAAVDIAAIVALITTVLPLIQQAVAWWRNRKNPPAPTPDPATV